MNHHTVKPNGAGVYQGHCTRCDQVLDSMDPGPCKRETPPNIALMLENKKLTQSIHDFLEFARGKGYQLGKEDPNHPRFPIWLGTEGPRLDALLYDYIDVDPDELEKEKQAILDSL